MQENSPLSKRTTPARRANGEDAFSAYHPAVAFFYFVAVIGCAMFVMHPAFLALALAGGIAYRLHLGSRRGLGALAGMMVAACVLPAVINPLFNHEGATILMYLPSENPLTLESIVFGVATGVMLAAVVAWFGCYQIVMTSDKFIYLFGKALPALSLVFSMVLRFVPRFQEQFARVSYAQRCIGRDMASGGALSRARHGVRAMSIMATWALESSVETADSMRSRGYGLRGRTSFSLFRFDVRDGVLTGGIAGLRFAGLAGVATVALEICFFAMVLAAAPTALTWLSCAAFGALSALPLVIDCLDEMRWRYLRSKI